MLHSKVHSGHICWWTGICRPMPKRPFLSLSWVKTLDPRLPVLSVQSVRTPRADIHLRACDILATSPKTSQCSFVKKITNKLLSYTLVNSSTIQPLLLLASNQKQVQQQYAGEINWLSRSVGWIPILNVFHPRTNKYRYVHYFTNLSLKRMWCAQITVHLGI